jgi:hypothetical protein
MVTIVWLDRASKARRKTTRPGERAAREFVRELMDEGHGDVRYRAQGEIGWKALRVRRKSASRQKRELAFPPEAKIMKERHLREKRSSDPLDHRLPGSFESSKRRS